MRDDQRRQLAEAFLKVVAVAVGVGAVIALGVYIMVRALGFGDSTPAADSGVPARRAGEHAPDHGVDAVRVPVPVTVRGAQRHRVVEAGPAQGQDQAVRDTRTRSDRASGST